jgi:23S rRNA pseudouridine1911/1915/1917 synthase
MPEDVVDHTTASGREVTVDGEVEAVLFDLDDIEADEIDGDGEPLEFDENERDDAPRHGVAARVEELRPERSDIGVRLDKYLAREIGDLSRSYIQQLIDGEKILVDGQPRRAAFKLTPGEVVTVDIPAPVVDELLPEPMDLNIVYEDDDVIVIDKPAGLVVHPAPGHAKGTLVNGLLAHDPKMSVGGSLRPGIVHRLDKDTSGLIVAARNDRARNSLVRQWEERTVEKRYIALVHGLLEEDLITIDAPIGRDTAQRQRMAVIPSGRRALTRLRAITRFPGANLTLVEAEIETGRTHQIRVHCAFIKHPIIGDEVYGRLRADGKRRDNRVRRQFLHAAVLGFNLPDGEPIRLESPLPADLSAALDRVRADEERAGSNWS